MKRIVGNVSQNISQDLNMVKLNGPLKVDRSIEFNNTEDYEIIVTCNMFLMMNDTFKGVIQFHIDPDMFFQSDLNSIDLTYKSSQVVIIDMETEGMLIHSHSYNMRQNIIKGKKYYDYPEASGFNKSITDYLKNHEYDLKVQTTHILDQSGDIKEYYWVKHCVQNYVIIFYVETNEVNQAEDNQNKCYYAASTYIYTYSLILIMFGWSIQFYFAYKATRTIQTPLRKISHGS